MGFNESLVEDVLKHADIVKIISCYLSVTKKGKNYLAVCPFHDDTSPSLTISPERQIFKCFACGTGGNAITFVQKYEKISFQEAIKKVADLSGYHPEGLSITIKKGPVDEKRQAILKCLDDLTKFYQLSLNSEEGKEGLDYFEKRHLSNELRNKYLLGYAIKDGTNTIKYLQAKGHSLKTIEDTGIASMYNGAHFDKNQGRVIFPTCDKDGNVIGFSARLLKDAQIIKEEHESKYINSPETYVYHKSSVLYNYHIAKEKAKLKGYVYVCEGFMDVFALARIGIDSVVALMGTAITKEHIVLLRALNAEIRICLDGDDAGQNAARKAGKILQKENVPFRIVDSQGNLKDPDEILNEDGEEALKKYLNNLTNQIDFEFNYYLSNGGLKTNEEKKAAVKSFLPIILNTKTQLEFDDYILKLSKITGFDVESLKSLVNRTRQNGQSQSLEQTISTFHPERKQLRKLQLAEREVLFQMLNNKSAVDFYEKNVLSFYDEVYRQIANFIIEYSSTHEVVDISLLVENINASDIQNKDELIKEVTDLSFEDDHPNNCDDILLNNLLESIKDEKERIFEDDILEQALKGKDPLEQARLIKEYNERFALKKKNK